MAAPTTAESHLAVLCGIAAVTLTVTAPEIGLPAIVGGLVWLWRGAPWRAPIRRRPTLADAVAVIEVDREGRVSSPEALSARIDACLPGFGEELRFTVAGGAAVAYRTAPTRRVRCGLWLLQHPVALGGADIELCCVLVGPEPESAEALLLLEQIGGLIGSRAQRDALRRARTPTDALCVLHWRRP